MKMYEQSFLVDIIEYKLLNFFDNYYPQGQYNNIFISYLYQYIRDNTYSGEHNELLKQLIDLKHTNQFFNNVDIKEKVDRQTYSLTTKDNTEFDTAALTNIADLVKQYYNYHYTLISPNRIEFMVNFGWLPPNTASWLNLLNDECLIDYYIDGTILRPNTHSILGSNRPDSGFVCYRIPNLREYDTVLFAYDKDSMSVEDIENIPEYKVASLLNKLEGSKGATLNRVVEFDLDNFIYELGPYNRNYLSTTNSSLIIQVPYEYAVGDFYFLYDVSNMVKINPNNNVDPNNQDNYFVAFNNPNFDNMFLKNNLGDKDILIDRITKKNDFDTILQQYLFGDFIWRTSDSKLIAYAQNLLNSIYGNTQLLHNGIWSDTMSNLIMRFRGANNNSIFDDDVISKSVEIDMLFKYKQYHPNLDPNEELFNQW